MPQPHLRVQEEPRLSVTSKAAPGGWGEGCRLPGSSRFQSVQRKPGPGPSHPCCMSGVKVCGGHCVRKWQGNQRGLRGAAAASAAEGLCPWLLGKEVRPLFTKAEATCAPVSNKEPLGYSSERVLMELPRSCRLREISPDQPSSPVLPQYYSLIFLKH